MDPKVYPSFGHCIFCGSKDDSTDEHIVPEALTGIGQMLIRNGSCRSCNNYANEKYEQTALNADFLSVRHMLALKRKRRGRKQSPRRMPKVSYSIDSVDGVGDEGFDQELTADEYPPIFSFVIHSPAGLLVDEDKSNGSPSLRVGVINLALKRAATIPTRVAMRERRVMGAAEMTVAKMAYCYAVAELGTDYVDFSQLRSLLVGSRNDVFNFVGSPIVPEKLANIRLHKFYFRQRGPFLTVLVHLFASFGGPIYEVVLGTRS